MIPKIIHYCWFGRGPKPALAEKCIASWRKYLPDYEIKEWNEDNFDVNGIPYASEAYRAHKYAFVSDYARFWILYNYGGLYFDTDVELIKSLDDMVYCGNFMCVEDNGLDHSQKTRPLNHKEFLVNPGLGLGAEPHLPIYKEMLENYRQSHFILPNGRMNNDNVVSRMSRILYAHGMRIMDKIQVVNSIYIYPKDWMCPIRITDGKIRITANTVSIHHYAASWTSPTHRFLRKLLLRLGCARLKIWLGKHFRSN